MKSNYTIFSPPCTILVLLLIKNLMLFSLLKSNPLISSKQSNHSRPWMLVKQDKTSGKMSEEAQPNIKLGPKGNKQINWAKSRSVATSRLTKKSQEPNEVTNNQDLNQQLKQGRRQPWSSKRVRLQDLRGHVRVLYNFIWALEAYRLLWRGQESHSQPLTVYLKGTHNFQQNPNECTATATLLVFSNRTEENIFWRVFPGYSEAILDDSFPVWPIHIISPGQEWKCQLKNNYTR